MWLINCEPIRKSERVLLFPFELVQSLKKHVFRNESNRRWLKRKKPEKMRDLEKFGILKNYSFFFFQTISTNKSHIKNTDHLNVKPSWSGRIVATFHIDCDFQMESERESPTKKKLSQSKTALNVPKNAWRAFCVRTCMQHNPVLFCAKRKQKIPSHNMLHLSNFFFFSLVVSLLNGLIPNKFHVIYGP